MGSITDIKSVLTRKGFDIFFQKFHIPEEVHPELSTPNQTIHEMPTGKIGVYTRFFEFTNFRLPLSTFLVDILMYYRIHLSQLSVIGAAKVSHFEILCRVHNIKPAVGLFCCFYVNSKSKWGISFSKRSDVEGGEVKLLDSTVRHVVSLLPVAPARAESELEANVNKLSDEGGKTEEDHIASIEVATGGKSPSVLNELLASSLLNVEAGVKAMATLTFITFSVSATLKREDYNPTDSVTGTNLRTIGPAERLVISPDSSHQSSTYAFGAEVASIIRSAIPLSLITEAVITTATVGIPFAPIPKTSDKVNIPVHASMFHDLDFVRTVKPDVAGPSHLPRKELSFGSREVDSEHLHEIRDMDYEQLFIEFNVGTTRQVCLNAEVRMRTEYCLSERKRLELECVNQANLLKAKDDEVERKLAPSCSVISLSYSGLTPLQMYGSKLQSLDLSLCSRLTDNELSYVASESCKYLKHVDLSWCSEITDNGIQCLNQNYRQLTKLWISGWCFLCFSGGGLKYLNLSSRDKEPRECDLTPIGLGFGAHMKTLDFKNCNFVEDATITNIAKGCPLLQEWNLSGCYKITNLGWVDWITERQDHQARRIKADHYPPTGTLCEGMVGSRRPKVKAC
nr:hypothetical protein [Tanacetum cinerariifolium]